jgi:hypothetical protein
VCYFLTFLLLGFILSITVHTNLCFVVFHCYSMRFAKLFYQGAAFFFFFTECCSAHSCAYSLCVCLNFSGRLMVEAMLSYEYRQIAVQTELLVDIPFILFSPQPF